MVSSMGQRNAFYTYLDVGPTFVLRFEFRLVSRIEGFSIQ
jgi:hypothetical protein